MTMTLPPGTASHRKEGDALPPLQCAILTVTDTRTVDNDESGVAIKRLIEAGGHHMADYALLPNNEARVRGHVRALVARNDIDAVLITGGTGLGSKDRTVEAVRSLIEKELPGFGELFRMVSFQEQVGDGGDTFARGCGIGEWQAGGFDAGVEGRCGTRTHADLATGTAPRDPRVAGIVRQSNQAPIAQLRRCVTRVFTDA